MAQRCSSRWSHAAVGVLPGQGLRLAGHGAARDGRARLDARAVRPRAARATAPSRSILTLSYLWLPYMILPIYAGLERLPDSLLDASADLGARSGRTFRSVVLPLIFPSIVAGSIFTFSLSLGDYITVQIVGGKTQMLGNVVYQNYATNLPFAAAVATDPGRDHGGLPRSPSAAPARWRTCEGRPMTISRAARVVPRDCRGRRARRSSTCPLGVIAHQLLQRRQGLRLAAAASSPRVVGAGGRQPRASARPLLTSIEVGVGRDARSRWCSARCWRSPWGATRSSAGRPLSLLVVLPIALPGIVTGVAFRTTSSASFLGVELSIWTLAIIGTPRSASSWSTTTRSPGCGAWAPASRRRRWTSAPAASRPSGSSPSR